MCPHFNSLQQPKPQLHDRGRDNFILQNMGAGVHLMADYKNTFLRATGRQAGKRRDRELERS